MQRPQRLVFGTVAERYDRYRPDYPAPLLDHLLDLAGPDPYVLDVGAGTGKVAAALAERGVRGAIIEPDAEMAAVAAKKIEAAGWAVTIGEFETCPDPGEPVDLITCAQAWHWIDDEAGFARAAALLRPGGVLAIMWNRQRWLDTELRERLDAVYRELEPDMDTSLASNDKNPKGPMPPASGVPGFTEAEFRTDYRAVTYTTADWGGLLGTHSNHLLLPDGRRERLHTAVLATIDEAGGAMELELRTESWIARRSR